ncbi:MAG: class I adenylate-forming enzyme family protein [Casimicrobiaceae bacterium]
MTENLGALLADACSGFASTTALQDSAGAHSYSELEAAVRRMAEVLRDRGLTPDEPVLVPVANEARDLAAFMGVWRAGGIVVPVSRNAPARVVEATRAAVGARFVATNMEDVVPETGRQAPPHRPMLAGAAIIVFTSGSTGPPKGVVLSHRAFAGKLTAIDRVLGFTSQTRALLVLQITFVFGLWVALLTLVKGGCILMHERFDTLQVLAALAEQRITDAAFVPTMLRKLLSVDAALAAPLTARIRLHRILTGGEPFGRELGRQLREWLPETGIVDVYGLTETCSSDFFLTDGERERFPGSIGHPSAGVRFRIADEQGRETPAGEVGELQIRTPFIMNGYLDAPELTRAAFVDGFCRTGDLARLRLDGAVELAGRAKDLIVRGGAKVSPLELDALLAQHPAVAAALTVGVPDAMMGERIHVLVVPRVNARVDEAELRNWVAERTERFKRPDVYHFGDALPTGHTGKVDRDALRRQIRAPGA